MEVVVVGIILVVCVCKLFGGRGNGSKDVGHAPKYGKAAHGR